MDVVADLDEGTSVCVVAAKAVIDRAFKAHDSFAVQDELAELGAVIDSLKAGHALLVAAVQRRLPTTTNQQRRFAG